MKKTAAVLLGLGLIFAACQGAVTGAQAYDLVHKQGAALVDVRTVEEYESGHLPGAINAPVQDLALVIDKLPVRKDQDVVVYCQSGSRSANAASMLKQAGFTKVHDLGAMSNWAR